MSYRSIKRVLGETSLERKCRFLFGACLLVLITASFWLYSFQTEQIVIEKDRKTGQLLTRQDLVMRHWTALEQMATVKFGAVSKFADAVPLLTESLGKSQSYTMEFILPNAPPRDEFERNVLKRFLDSKPQKPSAADRGEIEKTSDESSESDTWEYDDRRSDTEYNYYQPIRATQFCFTMCHQPLGNLTPDALPIETPVTGKSVAQAEGDLMAVAKLTWPTEKTRLAIFKNRMILFAMAIFTVFLAMIASYVIVRYVIVKPLRHLRDVSDAISRGNTTLRADIHTGDEFEELAVAFNRMLRHLTDVQQEIRQINANLDGKVDELAQANMRLYEMNTLKSDFLATMSHELRTPLNSILGFSEVLGAIDALDEKQKRYVQNIQKSGKTLLEMINDILDLAKIESGKMETRLTDFRIAQVVSAQCDMARPLTERKNIDLEWHVEPDLPPLHQDQARVQQILNNLLSNAIKFTPEGGRITVAVRRDESDFMVLQVIDTGVGIAEEDRQAIFEKFRQGRTAMPSGDTMTREYSGSGLGLSIVMELCKLLGGEVLLQSELGKGSTFTVRLPWVLEDQPRLDGALVDGFEEFTKQRFDLVREHAAAIVESRPPAPANG